VRRLKPSAPLEAERLHKLSRWIRREPRTLLDRDRVALSEAAAHSPALQTCLAMRAELQALWGRSMASREELVTDLQRWCTRAEASGIEALASFSRRLRSYA
jgi:stearoyl-CoA desaturase (Delta-9 desaturase)